MKVLGLGTDIVEIDRIEKAMNKTEKFMEIRILCRKILCQRSHSKSNGDRSKEF